MPPKVQVVEPSDGENEGEKGHEGEESEEEEEEFTEMSDWHYNEMCRVFHEILRIGVASKFYDRLPWELVEQAGIRPHEEMHLALIEENIKDRLHYLHPEYFWDDMDLVLANAAIYLGVDDFENVDYDDFQEQELLEMLEDAIEFKDIVEEYENHYFEMSEMYKSGFAVTEAIDSTVETVAGWFGLFSGIDHGDIYKPLDLKRVRDYMPLPKTRMNVIKQYQRHFKEIIGNDRLGDMEKLNLDLKRSWNRWREDRRYASERIAKQKHFDIKLSDYVLDSRPPLLSETEKAKLPPVLANAPDEIYYGGGGGKWTRKFASTNRSSVSYRGGSHRASQGSSSMHSHMSDKTGISTSSGGRTGKKKKRHARGHVGAPSDKNKLTVDRQRTDAGAGGSGGDKSPRQLIPGTSGIGIVLHQPVEGGSGGGGGSADS